MRDLRPKAWRRDAEPHEKDDPEALSGFPAAVLVSGTEIVCIEGRSTLQ
jgi:hypothetical protein